MGSKILVTSNANPDLDGYASSLAYADFLQQQGKAAEAILIGKIDRETEFVVGFLHDQALEDYQGDLDQAKEIVMVDTDRAGSLNHEVDERKITEIIDHREVHETHPTAKIQIEKVGACATLIAEKYFEAKLEPDRRIATYLYGAIISNTINLKNRVTTERDIKAADRLKRSASIPADFVERMFEYKSDLRGEKLRIYLQHDLLERTILDKRFTILQLEIAHVDELMKKRFDEILNIMYALIRGKRFDFYFINIIDILDGYNILITPDRGTQKLLKDVLQVNFQDNVARINHIIMRKEIVAKIKEYLENSPQ